MLGAVAGDVIGSVYEWNNIKTTDFPLFVDSSCFTDDTVLTVALADAIISGADYGEKMRIYYSRYPDVGFGNSFNSWASSSASEAYNSWGNGAAMRISPAGWAYNSLEEVLENAEKFTVVTHNHPEGIKGGRATAAAIFLARTGSSKQQIRHYIEQNFQYDLSRTSDEIRPSYEFDESCQGTVPEAITVFLESTGFENAIRLAISLGGDSDTLACITGSIAEAFYGGVPQAVITEVMLRLDEPMRETTERFCLAHCGYTKEQLRLPQKPWWKLL